MEKTNNIEKTAIINLQNEANVTATGTHVHHCSKPIICIETGETFVSITDAAEHIGVNKSNLSKHMCGHVKTIKGKHYCYMTRSIESLDAIVNRLRETAAMEEDARKWREQEAEKERIRKEEEARIEAERKAREKFEADKKKIEAKIMRRKEIANRKASEFEAAADRVIEAEKEYFNLTGEYYEDSITE